MALRHVALHCTQPDPVVDGSSSCDGEQSDLKGSTNCVTRDEIVSIEYDVIQ